MCILFTYINTDPQLNGYKLILASNRDEDYCRPAKPANFWTEISPHIVGGMDMEPGREGGTWLAMNSKTGRIGCLLNITTSSIAADKRGRGNLVTDYLNYNGSGQDYGQEIHKNAHVYNPFNLVMMDPLSKSEPLTYYSSASQDGPLQFKQANVYGFGNSLYHIPYAKVKDGCHHIEKLVQANGTLDQQDQLVKGLLDILKNTQRHFPDPQLLSQTTNLSKDFQIGLSSRFVKIPNHKYGSRTHTIILVDTNNKTTFMEWTMTEPITGSTHQKWTNSTFSVNL